MKEKEPSSEETFRYAEMSLVWSGWGSPVGLGIFLLSLGAFLVCLSRTGWLG
ncbi:MAG: hypothetical protein JWN04_1881 [Myxococcaceae bacterium]|nr:hypothetical protein [Myxococcaceae bacterium]